MGSFENSLWPLLSLAFVLGLSHGADPDHLTAIDGMTRASVDRHPTLSRWVGTWFAFGHSLSVLSIAVVIAFAAGHMGAWNDSMQQVGWLVSALLLFVIGTINVVRLLWPVAGGALQAGGLMGHLVPKHVLNIAHPLNAIPIGALFGLGFETASQMTAWGLAGTVGFGHLGAMLIGMAFCLGMVLTDSVNGLIVRRLYFTAAMRTGRSGRIMTVTVIGLAYGVGVIKLLQPTAFALSVTDAGLTIVVLGTVGLAFMASMMLAKRHVSH
ncbi:putative High-affinity nickel/cobalt transport protein [Nitrospira defluvii]|jgi:high-affinity nickel-transport protein|uniref:Nickel/cobalt efflux system n=1 Tax=Nitrospira defluvii TaxID=330214 RepID=D8PF17_9BACT|nr:putative High-affinity nickel/cobalt transport protein [Nitrospira defluvii]